MKFFEYIRNSRMATSGIFFNLIRRKLGVKTANKDLYQQAFTHSSLNLKDAAGNKINFERLEFLGDAMLSSIIAEYLFNQYPNAKEGKLTKLRAKIVSRKQLNKIGRKMELIELTDFSIHIKKFGDDIHGNLIESLIGAYFIDKGYLKTKDYVLKNIITPFVDMNSLDLLVLSYKALLIEWAQKEKKELKFDTNSDEGLDPDINYSCNILLERKSIAKARGISKKKTEEKVAKLAVAILKLNTPSENEC
ncbi:MAG: ribonuclease-3 [Flavobacteriaceae bacterium]